MIDPSDRLVRLRAKVEALISRQFLAAMTLLDEASTDEELLTLLNTGRTDEALAPLGAAVATLGALFVDNYMTAGKEAADWLSAALAAPFVFNPLDDRAIQEMQRRQIEIIDGFTNAQERASTDAVMAGILAGDTPEGLVRRFKRSLGLTPRQSQELEGVRRAALANDVKPAQIETALDRHARAQRRQRAGVVGRVEAQRAVQAGNAEAYWQALAAGILTDDQVRRVWNTIDDDRRRPHHGTMEGQERGITEFFTSGLGNALMFPGDPSAPAEDTLECRCSISTRILIPAPTKQ